MDVAARPTVRFSTKHLRSIAYNQLSNAVKYSDPGRPPQVQVRATCTAAYVVLGVQENSLGLSAEQQS